MAFKHVMFRAAAREKVLRGATQPADAVRITLEPQSKSVLIEKSRGAPLACNDGTIAKDIRLEDPEENLGALALMSRPVTTLKEKAQVATISALDDVAIGEMVADDPTKFVRIALENALAVASIVLLSQAPMTEIAEPKKEHERKVEAGLT